MNSELKYLIKPGGLLLALVVMLLLVLNFGTKQILFLRTNLNESKEIQRLLGLKLDILETVDEVLADDITFVDIALPSRGSVLYGISQIKKLAANNNVIIANLRTGSQLLGENGISKIPINFEAEGEDRDIYTFLASFYSTLPLMSLDKVRLDKSEGITRSVIAVNVYSADLPEKIPALAEGVDGFTSSDIETLKKLANYTLPDFVDPKPSEGSEREDPFN